MDRKLIATNETAILSKYSAVTDERVMALRCAIDEYALPTIKHSLPPKRVPFEKTHQKIKSQTLNASQLMFKIDDLKSQIKSQNKTQNESNEVIGEQQLSLNYAKHLQLLLPSFKRLVNTCNDRYDQQYCIGNNSKSNVIQVNSEDLQLLTQTARQLNSNETLFSFV